jgi:endonuclease YncB( thermonuclease family)
MKKITRMLLIIGGFFLAGECFAVEEMGKVVDVLDGDTLTVETRAGKLLRVRLKEVDAPEPSQTFGRQARQFARALLTGKSVRVKYKALDRYGRAIGEVILKDGRVLNRELLSHGLAWHYRVHFPVDESLKELEYRAWKLKAGLWIDPSAVPPWEFRRENNSRQTPPNDPTEMDYNDIFAHGLIGNPATKLYLWPDCPDNPEDIRGFAVFGSVLSAKNSVIRVSPRSQGR